MILNVMIQNSAQNNVYFLAAAFSQRNLQKIGNPYGFPICVFVCFVNIIQQRLLLLGKRLHMYHSLHKRQRR